MTLPFPLPGPRGAARPHRHYEEWFTGDGVKVQFFLTSRTFERVEDVTVYVAGLKKRPSAQGAAYDYKLRGLTAGFPGDRNAILFAVAPGAGAYVCVTIISA